jgi:peptidoglycan hydrolase CwlO-like protein
MEVKSRYEVIADLEAKKRGYIIERETFKDRIRAKEVEIRNTERNLEDMKSDLEDYKSKVEERKETLKELIKSVDESLDRFNRMDKK